MYFSLCEKQTYFCYLLFFVTLRKEVKLVGEDAKLKKLLSSASILGKILYPDVFFMWNIFLHYLFCQYLLMHVKSMKGRKYYTIL